MTLYQHLCTWWRERNPRCPRCGKRSAWDRVCDPCAVISTAALVKAVKSFWRDKSVRDARERNAQGQT